MVKKQALIAAFFGFGGYNRQTTPNHIFVLEASESTGRQLRFVGQHWVSGQHWI